MKRPLKWLDDETERPQPGRLPRRWQRFGDQYPDVVAAYDTLSEVCRQTGPLDPSAVALVKLAVSVGAGRPRTVHAHAKKALRLGLDPEALRQVALVALPTVGLPGALDALEWIDESVAEFAAESAARPRTRSDDANARR